MARSKKYFNPFKPSAGAEPRVSSAEIRLSWILLGRLKAAWALLPA